MNCITTISQLIYTLTQAHLSHNGECLTVFVPFLCWETEKMSHIKWSTRRQYNTVPKYPNRLCLQVELDHHQTSIMLCHYCCNRCVHRPHQQDNSTQGCTRHPVPSRSTQQMVYAFQSDSASMLHGSLAMDDGMCISYSYWHVLILTRLSTSYPFGLLALELCASYFVKPWR